MIPQSFTSTSLLIVYGVGNWRTGWHTPPPPGSSVFKWKRDITILIYHGSPATEWTLNSSQSSIGVHVPISAR